MDRIPRKLIFPAFAALITLGLRFPAMAQEGDAKEPVAGSVLAETVKKPVVALKKKPAKKKKKVKPPEQASEYKFQALDTPPAYTFDKQANPIIRKKTLAAEGSKKNKKSKAGGAKRTAEQPLPRLDGNSLKGKSGSAARYVCPMGEYEGAKPGTCPKCGMTLVEKA